MYHTLPEGWLSVKDYILIDLLSLIFSTFLGYYVRFGQLDLLDNLLYRKILIILILMDILLILVFDVFRNIKERGYYKEFANTIKHVMRLIVFFSFYLFITQQADDVSRRMILYSFSFFLIISYFTRTIWKEFLKSFFQPNKVTRSLLIISTEKGMQNILDSVAVDLGKETVISLADMDSPSKKNSLTKFNIVANRDTVLDYAARHWVDEVIIDEGLDDQLVENLIEQLSTMGIVVHIKLKKNYAIPEQQQIVQRLGNDSYITASINYISTKQALIKRGIDLLCGLFGSLAVVLLTLFIGPLIYIADPGPIFFKQKRIGKSGKPFYIYKFRTMVTDAEDRLQELKQYNQLDTDLMFKLEGDPRIIGCKIDNNGKILKKGLGNLLRDWSIDEFPQFFNVLKGDMSMVGTRPPTVKEWSKYKYHHRARLSIKPGITGLWQVSGRSNIKDFETVVELDRKYIENWSIGLDLRILLKTVIVVLKKNGSM